MNIAVTLGSNRARRSERWRELSNACTDIGFDVLATARNGLEGANPTTRHQEPRVWSAAVDLVADVLSAHDPTLIFVPHERDGHHTHGGTPCLVREALAELSSTVQYPVIEMKDWSTMTRPNVMVGSGAEDVADLVATLSLHMGEVSCNPYHLRLSAWMMDNVCRGAEVTSRAGAEAPAFAFATLHRLCRWADGRIHEVLRESRLFSCRDDLSDVFVSLSGTDAGVVMRLAPAHGTNR